MRKITHITPLQFRCFQALKNGPLTSRAVSDSMPDDAQSSVQGRLYADVKTKFVMRHETIGKPYYALTSAGVLALRLAERGLIPVTDDRGEITRLLSGKTPADNPPADKRGVGVLDLPHDAQRRFEIGREIRRRARAFASVGFPPLPSAEPSPEARP